MKHKNIPKTYKNIIFILNLLFSYVFILQWPLCVTEFHESSWEFWVCRWVSYPLSQAEALRLLKQAEIQEINAKDGRTYVRQSWIPRLVKHLRCCTVIKIKHVAASAGSCPIVPLTGCGWSVSSRPCCHCWHAHVMHGPAVACGLRTFWVHWRGLTAAQPLRTLNLFK